MEVEKRKYKHISLYCCVLVVGVFYASGDECASLFVYAAYREVQGGASRGQLRT